MKKRFLLVTATLLAVFSLGAMAGVQAQRFAVLDMQFVMAKAPQVKVIRNKLQKQFKDRQDAIVKQGNAFKSDAQKFQKDATIMSKKEKEKFEKKIMEEQHVLQQKQHAFQQDVMKAQNAALKNFIEDVKAIVRTIAKKKHFDLVMTKEMVAFSDDELDITQDVLTELRKS